MEIADLYKLFLKEGRISTDTRFIQTGDIFFALTGENFNGNKFSDDALKKGASYVVVDEAEFAFDTSRCIVVDNVLECLQKLAAYHRKQLAIPIIAIAGSNGKTTSKELMAAVLNTSYKIYYTQGNYNNEIGLPLSILNIQADAEIGILEMGAKNIGDIAFLCKIAAPTHGLITNIGKDHIEYFGSVENTLKANAELFEYLKENEGEIFINPAHKELYLAAMGGRRPIRYGTKPEYELYGKIEEGFPFVKISYQIEEEQFLCSSNLVGAYNLENILAAIAIGVFFNVSPKKINAAIANYQPKNNRSQLIKYDSNSVILDAYNANPSSMQVALESFDKIVHPKKMLILGDMLELGESSAEEHLLCILQVKKMELEQIVLVGKEMEKVKNKLDCLWFVDYVALKKWFAENLPQGYLILVKGSRSISLEKVFVN